MRKVYYSTALIFLIIAVAYVILFIRKICSNEPIIDITAILMMIFSFFMAISFWQIGKHCKKQVEKSTIILNETYQNLLEIYDDIKDSQNKRDELSVRLFVIGVHDFGCYVWDVVTNFDYPKEIRDLELIDYISPLMKYSSGFNYYLDILKIIYGYEPEKNKQPFSFL